MLITHRVIAVNADGTFTMRGDANPINDRLNVKGENILGKFVRKSVLYLWLGSFANTNKLFLLFVILPLALISVYELRSLLILNKKSRQEESEEAKKESAEDYERRMRAAIDFEKRRLAAQNYHPDEEEKKQ